MHFGQSRQHLQVFAASFFTAFFENLDSQDVLHLQKRLFACKIHIQTNCQTDDSRGIEARSKSNAISHREFRCLHANTALDIDNPFHFSIQRKLATSCFVIPPSCIYISSVYKIKICHSQSSIKVEYLCDTFRSQPLEKRNFR